MQTVNSTKQTGSKYQNIEKFEQYLDNYLKVYWLRPVSSLVRALEGVVLDLESAPLEGSADFACGDGLNTFVARGGEIPIELDAFHSVPLLEPEKFFSDKVDVYNFDEKREEIVIKNPRILWEYGLDHKQALLNKASQLKAYKKLILQDLNNPLTLENESLSFIFSNSLYWVTNLNQLLTEIYRVMKPGATAKFIFIKNTFPNNMIWNRLKGFEVASYLDMGRHNHYQQLLSQQEFEAKIKTAGFAIDKVVPMFNDSLVHMIEFHDYREISPITSFMSRKLSPKDYVEVKAEWIKYMKYLFMTMYKDNMFEVSESNSNYNIYFLSKK